MTAFLITIAVLAALAIGGWLIVRSLDGRRKKAIQNGLNRIFERAEERGVFPRHPAFRHDYLDEYPELRILEDNAETIREECRSLMAIREKLVPIEALGGDYTRGGIHASQWKTFMFKSGAFVEENCRLAPRTSELLRKVPGLYTAFFSVLEPHQTIAPHFGYYKGFIRYHLGVLIPRNNADRSSWIRINADPEDNARRDKSLIDRGETYYWTEGRGVMFDDTFLHAAANESDEVRVVLFLDLRRKMPWHLDILNRIILFIAHQETSVKKIRKRATVEV